MADIFISYARTDRETVCALADALEAAGYSAWWDRNISGGSEFSRTIERELEAARTVVVAWSATSIDSHWVRDEADPCYLSGRQRPMLTPSCTAKPESSSSRE